MTDADQVAHLADVPVTVRAEIERGVVRYRDLLILSVGAVLPTKRPAIGCVDVLVGECRIGPGEILTAGGKTVVRLLALSPRV